MQLIPDLRDPFDRLILQKSAVDYRAAEVELSSLVAADWLALGCAVDEVDRILADCEVGDKEDIPAVGLEIKITLHYCSSIGNEFFSTEFSSNSIFLSLITVFDL